MPMMRLRIAVRESANFENVLAEEITLSGEQHLKATFAEILNDMAMEALRTEGASASAQKRILAQRITFR
ncbi:hypothetical protein [Acidobacterium sp. S8]|uniref:hypothetical protein n=1 Tax=Acidobacterium sp. S8 TaxID=1641854 RepID=UPI00131E9132|nr:hypothetical protein [Acidobacterium sp. S8]